VIEVTSSQFLGMEPDQATEVARFLDLLADRMTRISAEASRRVSGVAWYGPDQKAVEGDVNAFALELRRAAERMAARAAVVRSAVDRQHEASQK
jgi:hypothetical protein